MSIDGSPESPELRSGEVIAGKYLLLAPLAAGGMGRVWVACNLATGADVAAKVLLPAHAASPASLARFRREAEAMAKLHHRAIVRAFDLVELDPERGSLMLVMELLPGRTLANQLEETGPLSVEATMEIVFPLLSALSHAHGLGIVHRDLKPENVFLAVEPDGRRMPKLMDFGISKQLRASPITLDGQIMGTLSYMSPEQTLAAPVDERSDIFALGILLYECLSGASPFVAPLSGELRVEDLMSVFNHEPRPLRGISPALWQVIRRALARDPGDRFASVEELSRALRGAVPAAWAEPESRSSSAPPRQGGDARSRAPRRIAAAVIAASIAVIGAASAGHSGGQRPPGVPALPGVARLETGASVAHGKRLAAGIDWIRAVTPPAAGGNLEPAHVSRRGRRGPLDTATALLLRDPGF